MNEQLHAYCGISIMIEDLLRQWNFQGNDEKYFKSNNTKAHYAMHLFEN